MNVKRLVTANLLGKLFSLGLDVLDRTSLFQQVSRHHSRLKYVGRTM
jgi:hypothetical protein